MQTITMNHHYDSSLCLITKKPLRTRFRTMQTITVTHHYDSSLRSHGVHGLGTIPLAMWSQSCSRTASGARHSPGAWRAGSQACRRRVDKCQRLPRSTPGSCPIRGVMGGAPPPRQRQPLALCHGDSRWHRTPPGLDRRPSLLLWQQ